VRVLEHILIELNDLNVLASPEISENDLLNELELSKCRRDSSGWSYTEICAANLSGG
jgi:hypothetical protein